MHGLCTRHFQEVAEIVWVTFYHMFSARVQDFYEKKKCPRHTIRGVYSSDKNSLGTVAELMYVPIYIIKKLGDFWIVLGFEITIFRHNGF